MRMRLRAKLNSLKKSLDVVINGNGSSDKENAKQVAAH